MKFTPKRLKYVADQIFRGDAPSYVDANGVAVVNQACVSPSGLELSKLKFHNPDELARISSWIQKNDVLINSTGTGTLGRVGHVVDDPAFPMFADGHVTIIRDSKERFNSRFLFYCLSIQQENITVECSEGATNQIELSRHRLGNKIIEWPLLDQQAKISEFLDLKTSGFDRLIAEKQKLLGTLAEKRRALITHAVTQGLDPKAPMRDSGIPWLGKIPAHWELNRAKVLFKEIDERSTEGQEELLSLRMGKGLVPHNDVSEKVILPSELVGYKKAAIGQLVINRMRAASGLIAIVPQPGLVSPDYAVFEPIKEMELSYYTELFQTPLLQSLFRSESKGLGTGESGFLRLYSENFLSIHLPVPPIDEQIKITAWAKNETNKIDALANAAERTINLLQERRSALISAAVTGQLEIGDRKCE